MGLALIFIGSLVLGLGCGGFIVNFADEFEPGLVGRSAAWLLAAVVFLGSLSGAAAWIGRIVSHDGPYSGLDCPSGQGVSRVELQDGAFTPADCVTTYGTLTFTNASEETSYLLCVGRDGTCLPDDEVPAALQHLHALEPGTSKTLYFPLRKAAWSDLERSYPITVESHPHLPDLIVKRAREPSGE